MDNAAEKLYNILGTKFDNTEIKTLTSAGKETTEMDEIKMFSFDFLIDDKNYGPVVILISAEDNLEVYYGDNTSKSLDRNAKKKWENLIEHLSTFARSNRLGFSLKHTTDLKYDLSNIADITESYKHIFESYYGTKKTSYNPQGKAKIIIKHSKAIGEGEARFRNISSLFIENSEGERFKLPFTKLAGARAMARHVTEGGNPYDLFGLHISEMVKDINTLGGFVRSSKAYEHLEEAEGLVETGRNHYNNLRKSLKQISGKRGYAAYKESWEPSTITEVDEDTDAIRKLFTEKSVNARVEAALPLLAKLQGLAETGDGHNERDEYWQDRLRGSDNSNQRDDKLDEESNFEDRTKVQVHHDKNSYWLVDMRSRKTIAKGFRTAEEAKNHGKQKGWFVSPMSVLEPSMPEAKEFESWATELVEGPDSRINAFRDFFAQEQPVGVDALNVVYLLQDIVPDNELFDTLSNIADRNPEADAREAVADWLSNNDPDLAHQLNLHGEYDNPSARDFPREGCENDLDADNETQLNASVNKDNDEYIRKPKTEGANMKPFTEYVAEAETVEGEVIEETVEVNETGELHVTMDNGEDLASLMQRTHQLLNR